ncbi:nitrate reductase associated protein [Merismopedia glauca]|uniref:Nitrate reductase associated protein n=1 Tax=Merismopedia glauca CCAP 1448/3 TaxID=1296344 RepID=A0A2T1C3K1_9CYAN|nr:nitrate reductase associated protein [Merismopedia glauca]PSB02855.1 nitrate reductase associated protein [Merismopedia glauca CCAP 1448/3]
MSDFFQFEADFVDSLRCIPMQVRLKLDTCGVKLKLPDWHHLQAEERQSLVELPCTTLTEINAYRQYLKQIVLARSGAEPKDLPIEENPSWMNEDMVPESVIAKAQESNLEVTVEKWRNLLPVERFALIKLSRSSHENRNFLPAAKEFHLL